MYILGYLGGPEGVGCSMIRLGLGILLSCYPLTHIHVHAK